MNTDFLKGILPAFLTAFTDDLSDIDTARIRKLARHLIAEGVHGLYVGGSSGEMLLCSIKERMTLLETVLEEANTAPRKTAIIAHVGATSTRDTVALARHAERAGAHALSSVTPLYFSYTFAEVKRFYEDLASATALPVIIYNIPARTGMTLNETQLHELLTIPGVAGMKHTSSDFFLLQRLVAEHPGKVFYNGSDEMLLSGLAAGAHGGIGTTYNVQPKRMLAIYNKFKSGDIRGAQAEQDTANRLIASMLRYGCMACCKASLAARGIDYGICRPPFLPLTNEAMERYFADIADIPIN